MFRLPNFLHNFLQKLGVVPITTLKQASFKI